MSTGHLREHDLDRLIDVIEEGRRDDPGEAMPWAVLGGLQRLIPCDICVSYQNHSYETGHLLLIQPVEPPDVRGPMTGPEPHSPDDDFWLAFWQTWCSLPQRTGDMRQVIHTGDFYATERQRRSNPMLEVVPEVAYSMIVSLPAPPGEFRRITFFRGAGGTPFDERDRQLAELIRPHLQEIWLDAERRRAGVPRLTTREWEVLALAAAGRSYSDIAGQLFVSVGTVRKHMEHVRERLGVHSIAAAAAVAMPHAPAAVVPIRRTG